MNRRAFLRSSGWATAGLAVSQPFAQEAAARWRIFEITTRVEVLKPVGATRLWVPTPLLADVPFQKTLGNSWEAEGGKAGLSTDPKYGAGVVWAEFADGSKPVLSVTSRCATRDVAVDLSRPGSAPAADRGELARFLAATELMPTGGIVKETSSAIVKGARTDVDKARALYEWVVENTYRDPKTRGCGLGDIKTMLEHKLYGGKCADLNALFVALARAEGLPARDVYGVRVAGSALGTKCLGREGGDITRAQHCRAEVYLSGYGWTPMDPADVRKVILEEGGGKKPDDPLVLAARKRLFGSWEMNWLAFNVAHDVPLPGAAKGKLPFFMYPQGETSEGRLDCLDPDTFKYTISAKELA